jgi:pimeloyl-ACP methyl ester carboxylesterase
MPERTISVGGRFQTSSLELGSGPPLLYLHGTWPLELAEGGGPFLHALAERHRVLAPWLPGFGASTGNEQLVDLFDLLYYELDLLDALGLDNLTLVGHSLGGMLAAELAAVQPQRFTRLVLIGPLGLWNEAYPVPDFFTFSPAETAAALFADPEHPAARALAQPPAEGDEMIAHHLERARSLATSAKYLWPIPNRGLAKRLHRVRMPTLLLWGERDPLSPPRYADDFAALLPRSERALVEAAAHLPQVEQPERTAEAVLRFLISPGSA